MIIDQGRQKGAIGRGLYLFALCLLYDNFVKKAYGIVRNELFAISRDHVSFGKINSWSK